MRLAETTAEEARIAPGASRHHMPRGVRLALAATLGLLVSGGVYLALVRGPAILIDLSGLARALICF